MGHADPVGTILSEGLGIDVPGFREMNKLYAEIGSWLGIESWVEEVTNVSVTDLITPGKHTEEIRKMAKRQAWGNLDIYSASYFSSQRAYKSIYTEAMMGKLGYASHVVATASILDGDAIMAYLQTKDPAATSLKLYMAKYATAEKVSYDWMEDNIGWVNSTRIAVDGGKTWVNLLVSEDDILIYMDFIQEPLENVLEDLNANYYYDDPNNQVQIATATEKTHDLTGTSGSDTKSIRLEVVGHETITFLISASTAWSRTTGLLPIGTHTVEIWETDSLDVETMTDTYPIDIDALETWDVSEELDVTDYGGYYRTSATKGIETYNIDTVQTTSQWTISSELNDYQTLVLEYYRGGTEWYHYIERTSTVPSNLYSSSDIPVSAIVPMKENNTVVDLGNFNLQRMLHKLNIQSDQFVDSLNNAQMDAAYIANGLPAETQTHGGMKTMFEMFDLMSSGSDSVNISIADLQIDYSFNMTKTVTIGSILDAGKYSNTLSSGGAEGDMSYGRQLIYQGSDTEYRTLNISEFQMTYIIGGQKVHADFGNGKSKLRLIIPLSIYRSLNYKNWVDTYEQSLCMISYTYEEIYHAWYESGGFSAIIAVVSVILTIYGFGWVAVAIWAAMKAVDYLVDAGIISGKIGIYLKAAIAIVAMFYGGGASALDIILQVVNMGTTLAQAYLSVEQMEFLEYAAEEQLAMDEAIKGLNDRQYAWRDDTKDDLSFMMFDMNIASRAPEEFMSTSDFVQRKVEYIHTQPEWLFEISFDSKIQVVSGPAR